MYTRNIVTKYYSHRNIMKINRSESFSNALSTCIKHLITNKYEATIVKIIDENSRELLAIVVRKINGDIKIVFSKDE